MRYGYSLKQAVFLFVVGPLVVVVGVVAWLSVRALEHELERRLQEDVELIARAIRLPLEDALEGGREDRLVRALESAFRIRRVYGAYVYDAEGRRIADVGVVGQGGAPAAMADLASRGERQGEYGEVGARRVYSYFLPLTGQGGEVVGMLQVTRRRREMEAYLGGVRVQVAGMVVGAAGLVVVLVLVGHRRAVGGPLMRLAEGMGRVEKGERGHRVTEGPGPREVVMLARGLNRMLDSLADREREVDRRRRGELELQERLQRSERLAAIGRLAGGVAHELGTPLSVVDGQAQRALRKGGTVGAWQAVRQEVKRMEATVRELLGIVRHEPREAERVTGRRLVRGALAGAKPVLREAGVDLGVRVPGSLEVEVSVSRMEQALANLVRNAAQSCAGGNVRVSAEAGGALVEFHVDDDGPGVSEESREAVFRPFFTTKAASKGTGMGLAFVAQVAEEHGGGVRVGEGPLGGARFTLWVPRVASGGGGSAGGDGGDGA